MNTRITGLKLNPWLLRTASSVAVSCAFVLSSTVSPARADDNGASPRLTVGPDKVLSVRIGDQVLLQSPPEGLWSIATAWTNNWFANAKHAQPAKVWQEGDWTCVSGEMRLPEGVLELSDAYRTEGDVVRGLRRFTWHGKTNLDHCTLSVRWIVPGATNAKPLLPGIVYYGNPSGAKTGRHAVAVHSGARRLRALNGRWTAHSAAWLCTPSLLSCRAVISTTNGGPWASRPETPPRNWSFNPVPAPPTDS
jgi:hypothetical protein